MPESVIDSFTGVFCDDTLIAKEIDQKSDAEDLQNDLNNIYEWTKLWGMNFNTDKCVFMTVTNKRNILLNSYHINNVALKKKENIKYLGVNIDRKLSFKQHTQEKSNRASTVLNMLKRNLYFAPKSVKIKAYQARVLPILEYASSCWFPTSIKENNSLEMVQHNAAKFVSNIYPKKGNYDNFSISNILKDLNWVPLEEKRNQSRLTMTYKILNGHVILAPEMMPRVEYQRPYRQCNEDRVGYQNKLVEPSSRTDVAKNTFFFATPKLWNNCISSEQANAPSVDAFKHHFKKQLLPYIYYCQFLYNFTTCI